MARRNIPDDVPEAGLLPDGRFEMKIVEATEGESKDHRYQILIRHDVVKPKSCGGMPYFERFTVGTEEDAEAQEEDTWRKSYGARLLKTLSKRAGVPFVGDPAKVLKKLIDKNVGLRVVQETDNDEDSKYFGSTNNRTKQYMEIGTFEAMLDDQPTGKAKPKKKVVDEEETEAEEEPPKKPKKPPVDEAEEEPPKKPAKVVDEDEEEEPPKKPKKPAADDEPEKPKKAKTVVCNICKKEIAREDFLEHVEQKHPENEED